MEERVLIKKKERAKADGKAKACAKLGEYYMEHGLYEQALEQFTEETQYINNAPMAIAINNRKQGEVLMFLNDFSKAIQHISAYLKWAKDNNVKLEIQRAYATLGRLHMLHAEVVDNDDEKTKLLKQAEQASNKSLMICKLLTYLPKADVAEMEGRLYLNISLIKEFQQHDADVVTYLKQAIELCRKNHLLELCHQCYMNIGQFYFLTLDDTTQTLYYCDQAIEISAKIFYNRPEKLCEPLILKANVFIKLSDFRSAKQCLHRAYKLKTTDTHLSRIIECKLKTVAAMCYTENTLLTTNEFAFDVKRELYEKLGDGACKLKNFNKAIQYYQLALKMAKQCDQPEVATLYVSLYETYKDNKQYDLALEYMEKELEANKSQPSEACLTLINIANVYKELDKNFWDIDNIYQRARDEAKKSYDKKLEQNVILKQLQHRQKHRMETLMEILKEEVQQLGDVDINNDVESQNEIIEDFGSEPKNVCDIGHNICLDDLTDDDNGNVETVTTSERRQLRRRGTATFKNKRNEKGETQLHLACISGNYSKAKQLIAIGHQVNVSDNAGWTPLHEACNHDHCDIVKLLIEHGASLDDRGGAHCNGLTPLHSACMAGSLRVIETMLDAGSKVTVLDNSSDTPLKTLEKWRMREKLNAETDLLYQTIRSRMIDILIKTCSIQLLSSDKGNFSSSTTTLSKSTTASSVYTEKESNYQLKQRTNRYVFDLRHSIDSLSSSDSLSDKEDDASVYKTIMESLRKGNKHPESSLFIPAKKLTPIKRSAVLSPGEIGEDWLEQDIIQPVLKRTKFPHQTNQYSKQIQGSKNMQYALSDQQSQPILTNSNQLNQNCDSDSDNNRTDAYTMLRNPCPTSSHRYLKRKKSIPKRSNSFNNRSTTLLDSGFYRSIKSPISSSVENDNSDTTVSSSQDSTDSGMVIQQSKTLAGQTMNFIKVLVENQKFIVPIKTTIVDDLTIKWLAEEAARRYYNLKGLEPILRLTTEDGAMYEDTDPLNVVLNGTVVCSIILDWTLPPITHRYMEACTSLKMNPSSIIKKRLNLIQSTQSLQISDNALDATIFKPLFKSLNHQSNLSILDLSNSYLFDDGLKSLAQSLPTLNHLTSLNLQGNLITALGVQCLTEIFTNYSSKPCLTNLQTLNLSFNPLQNSSIPYLSKFCSKLQSLINLNLSSTDLSAYQMCEINFTRISEYNISFNRFSSVDLTEWLKCLNSCKLTHLNIAFCHDSDRDPTTDCISDCLSSLFHSGTCYHLTELNVSGLNLTDGDLWQLVQSISKAKNLRHFYVEENPELTSISMKLLIERLADVEHLHCIGCPKMLDKLQLDSINILNPVSRHCKYVSLTVNMSSYAIRFMQTLFQHLFGADRCHFNIANSIAIVRINEL